MHPAVKVVAAVLAGAALPSAGLGQAPAQAVVDPLAARVDDSSARRFAELWKSTGGKPTAAQIQSAYLDPGGRAIEVFTPGRIASAENLARKIASNPALYRDAVERCLPWIEGTNPQLRATYLGMKGLLPHRNLPAIAVVIGANNSGGTAAEGIQVIGLEVICRLSPTRAAFEEMMRQFFAHETVHTLQAAEGEQKPETVLLQAALREGTADYLTYLVTGQVPNPTRHEWARGREEWLWQQFTADAALIAGAVDPKTGPDKRAEAAFRRWFANAGSPPEGWPDELGYWVGMRIAEAYVAKAPDQRAAIEELLRLSDPAAILEKSGYPAAFTAR